MELAQAVQVLRDELMSAAAQGVGSEVAFQVGPIQMEFAVELRKDARARGGIKAFVVAAETEGAVSRTRTHRISLTLEPRQAATGDPLLIAADDEGDATGLTGAGAP
ncbi:trypco2 family protein [Streptomyces sp. NPDC004647]|uniref:trypco2 family protein n=1 Tax=Streptomyces sp. NPDC004647 TaxID=3154671 RepID=UPI0033A8C6D6